MSASAPRERQPVNPDREALGGCSGLSNGTRLFWVCLLIVNPARIRQHRAGRSSLCRASVEVSGGGDQRDDRRLWHAARFAMNVPTGYLADRFGRHRALALGGAITVVGNLASGLTDVYWQFLIGRFVAGAGAAMVITGTQRRCRHLDPGESRPDDGRLPGSLSVRGRLRPGAGWIAG
ncbi:MAG: MFS transporter [Thermomicrobiales bacterium]